MFGFVLGVQHDGYTEEMEEIAAANNLEDCWATWSDWKAQAASHAHAISFAIIAVILGLVVPSINLSDKTINVMGWLVILGAILGSVFELYKVLPLMIIGQTMIIVGLLIGIIGVIKNNQ